jgi:hypothetical protein
MADAPRAAIATIADPSPNWRTTEAEDGFLLNGKIMAFRLYLSSELIYNALNRADPPEKEDND